MELKIEEVLAFEEMQIFDRKSINIEPKALAIPLVAFANADGGTIAIGISDKTRRIEGIDYEVQKLNELLRVPFDFCNPTIKVELEKVPCTDFQGRKNHVLLMHIDPSPQVHANQADEVFLRVGDKSKSLSFDERLQLTYDKGERYFEDKPVPDAGIEDIDMDLVKTYIDKIGYSKTPLEYLMQNKSFVREKDGLLLVSTAAILLFGKNPQNFFPRARVRFIRYEGMEEKFGTEMNVIKDVIFEGTILKMIIDAVAYLDTQIKDKTYLGNDGTFVTEEEYPKFVRQELIVNAVTHRAYSISGTDIQIKMFDNRIAVESPGKLPGLVRVDNIRYTHFSRNPKIAEFLKAYNFVKEYGEGVDRMCAELETAGLKDPEYHTNAFMLQAIIYNTNVNKETSVINKDVDSFRELVLEANKSAVDRKKSAIGTEKLAIDALKSAIEKQNYNEPTKKNITLVYKEIETNQIFSTGDIEKILDCSSSTARAIMAKMRDMEVVVGVIGKGKGKYRFIYMNEK
ncbi:ATP-binding protein [Lacrimispora sp.]|uniref:ATP-binding protein n=1 Tax=Lacrimispora sp. TaxID=2719234 RepID=UPI002FDB5D2E